MIWIVIYDICSNINQLQMRKLAGGIIFVFLAVSVSGQYKDTLTVMFYNLLNFPDSISTPSRQDTIRKTLQYLKPDVFIVCELNRASGAVQLLNSSLNKWGITYYAQAPYVTNTSSGDPHHQLLFYNSNKLGFKSTNQIATALRDVNRYVMYYKDPSLSITLDTTWMDFYAGHLKAGSNASDATTRNAEATTVMAYINGLPSTRNNIFGADFNAYTSAEACYGTLMSGVNRFYDPISRPGAWNNNSTFADVHTQSTRTVSFNGGATGGLDDRFDQLLVSANVISGANRVRYVPNTYKVFGNDALHYNSFLIGPPVNTSAPDSVIRALYYMSDHLPVIADFEVSIPAPLAKEVLLMNSSVSGRTVEVTWTLSPLRSTDHIELLHTSPGGATTVCWRDRGAGITQDYNWLAEWVDFGAHLFKVRITDANGYTRLSRELMVQVGRQPSADLIFPNPASGEFVPVTITSANQSSGTLTLCSLDGKDLWSESLDVNHSAGILLPLGHVAPGIYVLSWTDFTTGEAVRRKLVVRE